MKIHEYQGKEILRQFDVPVPRGHAAFTVREALEELRKNLAEAETRENAARSRL